MFDMIQILDIHINTLICNTERAIMFVTRQP